MLLDTARQCDLLPDFGTRGRRQLNLRQVRLDAQHTPSGRRRADVDEQQLVLRELSHLRLLLVLRLDAEQTTKQEQGNLEL